MVEVSLEKGLAERTCNHHENMLQLVRNLRKVRATFTTLPHAMQQHI